MSIGLCEKCQHAKTIASDRGSVFIMCSLSKTDESFPKYPRLPVLKCRGFIEKLGDSPSLKKEK